MGNFSFQEVLLLAVVVLVGYFAIRYYNQSTDTEKDSNEEAELLTDKRENSYARPISIVVIFLFATLPFHYVSYKGGFTIFPKDQMTFSNTYINDDDVESIIKRYNEASFAEKQAINSEPLMRKLREKGIVIEKTLFDSGN